MIFGNISGRLTSDPQVKQGNNSNFTTFSIAVNHGKKDHVEQVTFVECTANGKTGEFIAQRFKKGNVFSGPAELKLREYESNGQKNKALSASISMIDWQASQPTPQDQTNSAPNTAPPQHNNQPPQQGYGAPPQYNNQPPQGYHQPPQQGYGNAPVPGGYQQPGPQYGGQAPQPPAPPQHSYNQPPQQPAPQGYPPQQAQQPAPWSPQQPQQQYPPGWDPNKDVPF